MFPLQAERLPSLVVKSLSLAFATVELLAHFLLGAGLALKIALIALVHLSGFWGGSMLKIRLFLLTSLWLAQDPTDGDSAACPPCWERLFYPPLDVAQLAVWN